MQCYRFLTKIHYYEFFLFLLLVWLTFLLFDKHHKNEKIFEKITDFGSYQFLVIVHKQLDYFQMTSLGIMLNTCATLIWKCFSLVVFATLKNLYNLLGIVWTFLWKKLFVVSIISTIDNPGALGLPSWIGRNSILILNELSS